MTTARTETRQPPRVPRAAAGPTAFTVTATILGTDPPVWRRLHVPASWTLAELHVALQAAFGWEHRHRYRFDVSGTAFVSDLDDLVELDGAHAVALLGRPDQTLAAVTPPGTHVVYRYGVAGHWQVAVEVAPCADTQVPRMVAGARNAPPDDIEGPDAFARLVTVMGGPDTPERQALEAATGAFDPDAFSTDEFALNVVSRALRDRRHLERAGLVGRDGRCATAAPAESALRASGASSETR